MFSHLEFDANELDPQAAATALEEYGAILLKSAHNLEFLDELYADVSRSFSSLDERKADGTLGSHHAWAYKFGVNTLGSLQEVRQEIIAGSIAHTAIAEIASNFFNGSPLYLQNNRIVMRRQRAGNKHREVPYHQDLYTQPKGVSGVINFWTPFVNAGVDAPGVEVVPVRFKKLLPTRPMPLIPENESFDKIHITRESVIEMCDGKEDVFWHPEVRKGDTLVFMEDTIHRTYITPDMPHERQSIEIRVLSESSVEEQYRDQYVDLYTRIPEEAPSEISTKPNVRKEEHMASAS